MSVYHYAMCLIFAFVNNCFAQREECPSWSRSHPVIIIGAGIAGLTTGILLKQRGIPVKIYEKKDRIESIGGALSIWPIGGKILLRLPCSSEIQQLAGNLRYEHWGDTQNNTLHTVDREKLRGINSFPFLNLCRSELQQLLLATFGLEDVIFSATCTKIEEREETVLVHFKDQEVANASLVIGADGTFSTVRKWLFPESQLDYTGYVTLVGIFRFHPGLNAKNHVIWGKNRLFVNFDVSDDRQMIYTACPLPKDSLKQVHTKDKQIELFSNWSEEVDCVLDCFRACQDQPEFSSHYFCNENYDMKPLDHWRKGKVVLLGDAAHPMGSINGFGSNLALEDAQALTDLLVSSETLQDALQRFEQQRIAEIDLFASKELKRKEFLTEAAQDECDQFYQVLQNSNPEEFIRPLFQLMTR